MSSAKANWSRKIRRARNVLRNQAKQTPERVKRAAALLMSAKLGGKLPEPEHDPKIFTHTHEAAGATALQDVAADTTSCVCAVARQSQHPERELS